MLASVFISLAWGAALAAPVDGAVTVGEVVVTAEKHAEKLEVTPVAVSAYGGEDRIVHGVDSIQDLASRTPGFEYSASADRAYIRGVGREGDNVATDPGVATYVDGVYNASIAAAVGDSLFVDRLEILRGPQGTLYGRNAIGGAINAISQRPTDHPYAEVRLTEANYLTTNIEGAISGPVSDKLRLRLSGLYDDQRHGYFNNLAGGPSEGGRGSVYYLEAQAALDITSDLSAWVKAGLYGFHTAPRFTNTAGSYDYSPFPTGAPGPGADFGYLLPGFTELGTQTTNPGATNIRDFSTNTPSTARLPRDFAGAAQIAWRTPWAADLKYIGGYSTYGDVEQGDGDNSSVTSYQFPTIAGGPCGGPCPPLATYPSVVFSAGEHKTFFSNELDISSNSQSRLQWIVGLYQFREQYDQPTNFALPGQSQLAAPIYGRGMYAAANPGRSIYFTDINMHADSYAGFGQLDWRVAETLKLTGGMRWTRDSKSGVESTRQLCLGLPGCVPAYLYGAYTPALDITPFLISSDPAPGVASLPTLDPATGVWSRRLSGSWSALTGTAGAEWTPTADMMAYVKYSRGYKSGGFNAGAISASPETGSEFLDAWEVGSKSVIERRLQINTALFYYKYSEAQIPLTVQPKIGPPRTVIINLPVVISYGAELETTWQATRDLQLVLSYAYLHATLNGAASAIDNVQPQLGSQSIDGATVPEAPRNKLSLDASYTWRFASGALTFSPSYVWKDRTWYAIFNRPWNLAPAYGQVDMRLLWNDAKNRYTLIAYVKNLTDALHYDNAGANLLLQPAPGALPYDTQYGVLPPRLYGMEVQYRFQ